MFLWVAGDDPHILRHVKLGKAGMSLEKVKEPPFVGKEKRKDIALKCLTS